MKKILLASVCATLMGGAIVSAPVSAASIGQSGSSVTASSMFETVKMSKKQKMMMMKKKKMMMNKSM